MSIARSTPDCPECGGSLVTNEGEKLCDSCGLILEVDDIDLGPEWRFGLDDAEQRRRVGAPLTPSRHDKGLSTEIGYASGAEVPEGNPRKIARMRREHNRANISSKADRNLVYGFIEIRRICSALGLPDSLVERACVIFRQAQRENLFKGRSIEGFAAAAVYAACRVEGFARTRDEIVEASRADQRELDSAYDALNRDLGLPIAPVDPRAFLPRFASTLDLESAVELEARRYANWLIEEGLAVGRKPGGIAGGCLYRAACDREIDINQCDVAEVAGVSPVTIRGVCNLLNEADEATTDSRALKAESM